MRRISLSNNTQENSHILDQYGNPLVSIGYGSGFKKQAGYDENDKPMKDFIFGVKNTKDFHEFNLEKNNDDYSYLAKKLGVRYAQILQNYGCKIYYHPYIDVNGQQIKYGVISVDDLIDDLVNWTHIYIAGRLHKPVEIFNYNAEFKKAYIKNLESALKVSLILLGEEFSINELYETITGLSYRGDSRMKNFENKNKVSNIFQKDIEGFNSLYLDIINNNPNLTRLGVDSTNFQQDKDEFIIDEIFFDLPKNLVNKTLDMMNDEDGPETLSDAINISLSAIVNKSSKLVTIKGQFTSGLKKSMNYVGEKRKKAKK